MNDETKLDGDYPQSGRTTAMLQQVIDCVLEGQPKSVVIGVNWAHAETLRINTLHMMQDQGIKEVKSLLRSGSIIYEDSEIRFISRTSYQRFMEGRRGWGEFWDHAAEAK